MMPDAMQFEKTVYLAAHHNRNDRRWRIGPSAGFSCTVSTAMDGYPAATADFHVPLSLVTDPSRL
jgi:hypothetical protein